MGARLLGTAGWCGGEREKWSRVKGVMQLWALPALFPRRKRAVYGIHLSSTLSEEGLGRVQRGGCLFVCSQSATIKNLSSSEKRHIEYSIIVHWSTYFLQVLPRLSVYFNLLLRRASSCTHFFSLTLLCPSHPATWLLWQRYTKWRRGAESWKAESGSHFLTDPGLGTDRVKTFYAWWTIKSVFCACPLKIMLVCLFFQCS